MVKDSSFRESSYKAVLYSKELDRYYVSTPCKIDGGATRLSYLFGFENYGIENMISDLTCSVDYMDKFEEKDWETHWTHVGNLENTGVTIKGTEVFDGDIIKHNSGHWFVKFSKGAYYLYHSVLKNYDNTHLRWGLLNRLLDADMGDILEHIEVFGNIYENQKILLEVV